MRRNPETGQLDGYYRLVESYRNIEGRVCHRTLLNVGFLPGTTVEQRNKTQSHLNDCVQKRQNLFVESDEVVKQLVEQLWNRLLEEKCVDMENAHRMINADTMRHRNVREVGSEWIGYTTWNQLQLTEFLSSQGWTEEQIQLAATQVIGRAVYPASELKTSRWIKENSAVCELTGYDMEKITKDKLYESALRLYGIKDGIEKHLSNRTNSLFDLEDKIILYDLTNTYFEGRKEGSELSRFGRSKEKRNDAKLVVLAMVVNIEGFIKYTAIHEGNIADCKTLAMMIDKLSTHTCNHKAVIVLDAGIATEENLDLIRSKGHHYVCVSRTKLKNYSIIQNRLHVLLETRTQQEVLLKAVQTSKNTDYYLEVTSEAKIKTERSMKSQFEKRFEEELEKIKTSVQKKGGTKTEEKVYERIGRAKAKYPTVHHYYKIEVCIDKTTGKLSDLIWAKDEQKHGEKEKEIGVYFLRTDMNMKDELIVWNIYNTIREIESSFRCLKTDLDLRPIYHKNDESTMAHLHLGILAYWLVNTIRHQLKAKGINSVWKEIVRIGNTQKMISTTGQNTFDKTIHVRKCSEPNENLKKIFDALNAKYLAFRKQKSVVHKPTTKKNETPYLQLLTPS